MRVQDLSETELIARFAPLLPPGVRTVLGPGDDAAVLAPRGDVVVTTDVLVEGIDFRTDWSTGSDVGWRAAMQNLADVVAMGAVPTALVVALTLPGETPAEWVEEFARGLAQACGPLGVGVVGGDLSGGPVLSVAVTALGDLDGAAPVTRGGARAGDIVAHAGVLGHSAAGLALLLAGEAHGRAGAGATGPAGSTGLSSAGRASAGPASAGPSRAGLTAEAAIESFRRPDPPLSAGLDAARAGASAMLDVSDGLLRDAARIGAASGVRLDLSGELLAPAAAELVGVADLAGEDPLAWVLTGGEDHGFLATFPRSVQLPASFRALGVVVDRANGDHHANGDDVPHVTLDGQAWHGSLGWDHFRR